MPNKPYNEQKLKEFFENIINKKIDTSEVITFLNETSLCEIQLDYQSITSHSNYSSEVKKLEDKCFHIKDVEGGGEGEGEYYHEVIYIPPLNTYILHTGTYYSYDGVSYLSEYYQCEPKDVIKTEYTRVL